MGCDRKGMDKHEDMAIKMLTKWLPLKNHFHYMVIKMIFSYVFPTVLLSRCHVQLVDLACYITLQGFEHPPKAMFLATREVPSMVFSILFNPFH